MWTRITSPDAVDWEKLETYGPDYMREHGTLLSTGLWSIPAHYTNYRSAARTAGDIDQIVVHTSEGYTGGLLTFQDPNRNASYHYSVQRNGDIAQIVQDNDIAWHAGGYIGTNDRSIGIGHAGFALVGPEMWKDPQVKASARLAADLASKYDIPIDRDHIIGHYEVPDQTHMDPGPDFPWDRYLSLIRWYQYRPFVLGGSAVALAILLKKRRKK